MILPLAVLAALAAPLSAEGFTIHPDARLEFVGAVELASGGRAKRFVDPKDAYAAGSLEFLKPFRAHPALALQAGLPKPFDFLARCDIADRLTADFETTTSYFLPDPTVRLAGGRDRVDPWLAAMSDLKKTSNFDAFFSRNKAELEARAEPFRRAAAEAKVLEAIEEYAGRKFDGTYEIRVSPYFDGEKMLNAVWSRAGGTRELDTIVGTEAGKKNPDYYFRERFPAALWHQFSHGYFDAAVESARAELALRGDGRKEPCYGAWEQCVKENIVRAVTARLLARRVSETAAKRFLHDGDQDLYPMIPALIERLKEYEGDRARWPTLDAFLPRLFAVFPTLEPRPK